MVWWLGSKCNLVFEVTSGGARECNLVFVLSDLVDSDDDVALQNLKEIGSGFYFIRV
jgi:hypothetical protein